jgi:site-specific recombinase XerD
VRCPSSPPGAPASRRRTLTDALTSAARYATEEKAAATKRAYLSDWRDFRAWCDGAKSDPLPASPATVAAYLAHLADAGLKASTIGRKLAAIAYAHRLKGRVRESRHRG